ncbi:nitrogenase molybdenum-iron cofactor biosynthesis protein NifN [Gloeothece citriformis PCC 7424]|uniref:Nitrogenase iron-molybdenum cofactor biosynthesis protein NifN n=1 Tax=Gloeothece citriformis (strain PCC 7424) TaxID=65393 RepID=B7KG72_GLOC7|nr:nitrogenase iron-molybdenum cofactor biosynthesis protein NifN [Gloeothece citriformis]ACK70543.1 nitrogenase molybdenum-iron cofactor biosynthesis protein NifN [Gloeothece citriformis PCC 7424]
MTTVLDPKKSVSVNPLKLSQPLGAALAFLGLKGMMPLFHGSQGCTAFAKVLLVRHFREAIPLATTAMTEVSTILGGEENIEQALLTLVEKAKPDIIGLLTTGLTETRGDDMKGILKAIRQRNPQLKSFPIVSVSTPDYKGAMQDGYAAAVQQIVSTNYGDDVPPEVLSPSVHAKPMITVLPGSMLSPGDVEEIKEIIEAFGIEPLVVPDLSGSVDGHLEDEYYSVTTGGTTLTDLRRLERSTFTLAIGESMRGAAEILKKRFGTNYEVFPRLTGLDAMDNFIMRLSQMALNYCDPHFICTPFVPDQFRRQRKQLQDAILDSHFYFGGKQICLAMEPDLLYSTSWLLKEMGAVIKAAVTTTKSPLLYDLPVESVKIGDLQDLEDLAVGSDLIITNSHGKGISDRLGIPLYRMGYPIFDRLGNGQLCLVGYRGTIRLLFDIGNILQEQQATH